MISDIDICPDCDFIKSSVATILPEGWQKMSDAQRNYFTSVKCECGRVLKHAGTYRTDKIPGFRWAT